VPRPVHPSRPGSRAAAGWLAALTVVGLLLVACSGGSNSVDQSAGGDFRYVGATTKGHTIPLAQRKPAGNATAPYLDGTKKFSLDSMRGQVVVLNYWASWCAPCRTETPGLERTYTATKAQGVAFVGVNVKDEKGGAASFVKQHDVTYPIVFDEIAKTALQLGRIPTFNLPSTVVIDRAGRVAAVYSGPVQQGDLQPVVTALAREK
jgi:peroxiredoxin